MQIKFLPMNRKVGRVTPYAPTPNQAKPGAYGVSRPTLSTGERRHRAPQGRAFLSIWLTLGCVIAIFLSAKAAEQTPEKKLPAQPARYETRTVHDPDGIGKFYMGREIAHVMGHQAAEWLERPEREEEEKTELLVELLKLKPGEVVADIGAGTGYFSRRLSKKVGYKGLIYAVEIQQEMLDILTNKMAQLNIRNVKPVLGTITNPKLPPASVDTILMVDVYHEFDHPFEMVEAMSKSLKPGGRMVFVEFRGEDPNVPIKRVHKMTEAQVRKEMAIHPLTWAETIGALPRQHIIVFQKRK